MDEKLEVQKEDEQESVPEVSKVVLWDGKVILSFAVSLVFIGIGFYKIFAYKNYDDPILNDENVNAYVSGDAYNYIINSNLGIAYFVLALIFVLIACTFLICNNLLSNKK